MRLAWIAVAASLLAAAPARADREFAPDRPNVTEGPFTLDPGRVQIESSAAEYTRAHPDPVEGRLVVWATPPTELRVGVTRRVEAQVLLDGYLDVKLEDRTGRARRQPSGFGDVTLRAKLNLWGDDGGATALALIPFVKVPTAADGVGNGAFEGGLLLPFAASLPHGWDVGAMTEVDSVRSDTSRGYRFAWVNTATVGHDLVKPLYGFAEIASVTGTGRQALAFDFGVVCTLPHHDVQLDVSANLGLTDAADDIRLLAGIAKRF